MWLQQNIMKKRQNLIAKLRRFMLMAIASKPANMPGWQKTAVNKPKNAVFLQWTTNFRSGVRGGKSKQSCCMNLFFAITASCAQLIFYKGIFCGPCETQEFSLCSFNK